MDLLTVGEAFDDVIFAGLPHLPRLGEEIRVHSVTRSPGGGALITAIAAARLGLRVGTISALSAGSAASLRAERVSTVNLRGTDEPAAVSVALSTPRDRAFVTFEGVNRALEPRLLAAARRLRRAPRHVHFALSPKRCQAWTPIVATIRRRGATTSWDFGWNEALLDDSGLDRLLAAVDWVFVNEREAMLYARKRSMTAALERWRTLAQHVVIKLGPRGAQAVSSRETMRKPAPRVRTLDTTGAGDAFNAGFLAALVAGASLGTALRLGNHVGAQSTRAVGGVAGLPRHKDLPSWARLTMDIRQLT